MIVFGHNNFVIKSFTPEQVGYPQEEGAVRVKFEVRQRYAHIFWIPFFPIGKIWAMKMEGDSSTYEVPAHIKGAIKDLAGDVRAPWYSYSLLLVGMAIGLFLYLSELQRQQDYEDDFYNNLEEAKMLIQYPTTGDCYIFKRYEDPQEHRSTDLVYKVRSYTDSHIEFVTMYDDPYREMESEHRWDYHDAFDVAELSGFNPILVGKEALKKALAKEYAKSSQPVKIEPLDGYFKLSEVDRRVLED